MLSNELMGVLALGILWVNTLLIAASALKDARALLARRAQLTPLDQGAGGAGLVRARIVRGLDDGPLALLRTEQRGRAARAPRGRQSILFEDRGTSSESLGGAIEITGLDRQVTVDAARDIEVWLGPKERLAAAACPSDRAFDQAYDQARKARGFARTVEAPLLPGQTIFAYGRFRPMGAGLSLEPDREGGLLLASFDPRAWLLRTASGLFVFVVLSLLLATGLSALALQEPYFETVSKIGAFFCALFFVLIQPVSVALRDASRVPSRAFLRGRWTRQAIIADSAASPHAADVLQEP